MSVEQEVSVEQEAPVDLGERADRLRYFLNELARERSQWGGIPLPLTDHRLVIEPNFPHAAELMSLGATTTATDPSPPPVGFQRRNTFWSVHRRAEVLVWSENGRIEWGIVPGPHHFEQDLASLGASDAWGMGQEANALELLHSLVCARAFKQYLLTGMFLETSPRSQLVYVFRRLKPTVALSARGDVVRILCTLCLHPIGYYAGSWAGAMCPTDDVIAHLMLMRGDEAFFWRCANQHPAFRPEAGL